MMNMMRGMGQMMNGGGNMMGGRPPNSQFRKPFEEPQGD
jgi:hypothetical protein